MTSHHPSIVILTGAGISKESGLATFRDADGIWAIAIDHLDKAAAYEAGRAKDSPVEVKVLSSLPLEKLTGIEAETWLDHSLVNADPAGIRDAGFGKSVQKALQQRRQWLIAQGLAEEQAGQVEYRAGLLNVLRRQELARVAGQLSQELGLAYVEASRGERVEGIYRRSVMLASGRMAVIAKTREFTLVPWRPVMERQLGKFVAGVLHGDQINWSIGRSRGPAIG